ncbi:glycosyltransferase family 2 protein [Salinisphaera sp.]|uniref:glycosyltransferase family 2 protein n=1 Tax=Salinisphaera sp. TaxID=1914330 RepID=UPI003C79C0F2
MTAYNVADYIEPCLASLLVPEATQCEIIVVDDGSTDATPKLATLHHDPRLRLIRQTNGGPGSARNTGLDAARGDYILFVDGDDWVQPDLIPQCLAHVRQYPDADLFVFDYADITANGRIYRSCGVTFWDAKNAAWNKLYSRRLIDGDRFDEDIWYEDLAIVRPWVARAGKVVRIDTALYNYRFTRPGSIMNSHDVQRFLDLVVAGNRCVDRIETDAMQSHGARLIAPLGTNWKSRLYTDEIFIPGIIEWSRKITNPRLRRQYARRFMAAIPDKHTIDIHAIRRYYGRQIAAASLCYLLGAYLVGDTLLHRFGGTNRGSET